MGRPVARTLIKQSADVIPGSEWRDYYAFFGRHAFTEAAQEEVSDKEAFFVDLARLDADLRTQTR